MLVLITYTPGVSNDPSDNRQETSDAIAKFQHTITIVTYAGLVPAMLLGYFLSWLRIRYFTVTILNRFRWVVSWYCPWYRWFVEVLLRWIWGFWGLEFRFGVKHECQGP